MTSRPMSWCALVALASLPVFLGGCQQEVGDPTGVASEAANPNGAGSIMPAFFNGQMIMINAFEVPGEQAILAHNKSINQIYVFNDLDEPQVTMPVINAFPGHGFNPLWQQIFISQPTQFTSEADILAAACCTSPPTVPGSTCMPVSGCTPTITLTADSEVYRCSVVGKPAP
jgi:hypothetical protein